MSLARLLVRRLVAVGNIKICATRAIREKNKYVLLSHISQISFVFSSLKPESSAIMNKVRYINMCIVEFGKKFGMTAQLSYQYLKRYYGLVFLDKCYEAEHLLSLEETLRDLKVYCKRHGGTIG